MLLRYNKNRGYNNGAAGQALIKAAGSADISSNNSISENGGKINTFDKKLMMRENLFQKVLIRVKATKQVRNNSTSAKKDTQRCPILLAQNQRG
ncbi:MAG: hypothetical protein IJD89_05715, partial [Clostridia bacterium]|nr:hypothetical protein [Clostridia bacterium]